MMRRLWAWHGLQRHSGLEELSCTLPTAVKFFCNEINDFALSGAVLMTTHRVVATRLLTRVSITSRFLDACFSCPFNGYS
jgi:hypothetical protein